MIVARRNSVSFISILDPDCPKHITYKNGLYADGEGNAPARYNVWRRKHLGLCQRCINYGQPSISEALFPTSIQ